MYRDVRGIHDAPDASGEAPVTPLWRAPSLALSPIMAATDAASREDEGPMRLIRHERVPEDGHQRGR